MNSLFTESKPSPIAISATAAYIEDAMSIGKLTLRPGLRYEWLELEAHAPGKPAKLKNIPLEDFARGLDWLKKQPGVDASRLGIVGYSKGAEAGLLVATRELAGRRQA